MIELVPFVPTHAAQIVPQAAQHDDARAANFRDFVDANAPLGQTWTVLVDGVPMACGGLIEMWQGRAYAWALLGRDIGPHLLALTRAICSHLNRAPFRRVELVVESGFDAGSRWARLMGFELETPQPLRQYLPNGRDAWLYARFRDGRSDSLRDRRRGDVPAA